MSTVIDNGHWRFGTQMNASGKKHGFIYMIVEKTALGAVYVGRKKFQIGGREKGFRHTTTQSNWRSYTSSSTQLNELIREKGSDAFHFFVLEEYDTSVGMQWAEIWTQCVTEAPSDHRYLNIRIEGITWKSRERISATHRARLNAVLGYIAKRDAGC